MPGMSIFLVPVNVTSFFYRMGKEKVASNIRADHELFLQSFESK